MNAPVCSEIIAVSRPITERFRMRRIRLAVALPALAAELVCRRVAVKYGALSAHEGHVLIDGKIERLNGDGRFSFLWSERGGPRVSPPTRKGFGSVILLDSAEQFGRVTTNYAPEGLTYELQMSLSAIEASANRAKQESGTRFTPVP